MNLSLVQKLKEKIPFPIRAFIQKYRSMIDIKVKLNEQENPYRDVTDNLTYLDKTPVVMGILKNFASYHKFYIAACEDLKVPYKVIDISMSNWMESVKQSECNVFLVWPDAMVSIWNEMVNDRIQVMEQELGLFVYPTFNEIYRYENKRRLNYWLEAHNFPRPQTWVFYNLKDALQFTSSCNIPIVHKTNFGSSAKGVRILRSREEVVSTVRKAFKKGFTPIGYDLRDTEWGTVLFQEYLEDVKEWRLVRVNESYFCREKIKVGDYHSGSGAVGWAKPPSDLLDRIRTITNTFGFTSMNIDFFETNDGRFLINELHTVFGAILEKNLNRNDEFMGRWKFNSISTTWEFEHGYFYQNACANLRIEYILDKLLKPNTQQ